MSDETYVDSDGKRRGLDEMCRHEPAWAANTIRHLRRLCDERQDELAARDEADSARKQAHGIQGGGSATILCPFHVEKTPSCIVREGRYRCLGCGAHGDVVDVEITLSPPKAGGAK